MPALRLPGEDGPWGLWGMNQRKSVAGLSRHSRATAFPFMGGKAPMAPGGDKPAVD